MKESVLGTAVGSLYTAVSNRNTNIDAALCGRSSMEILVEKYTNDLPTQSKSQCRPWNYADYLNRLHSFHYSSDWFAKPECISPPECSLRGWSNNGRDKLICFTCSKELVHNKDDVDGSEMRNALIEAHDDSCGWKGLSCESSFLDLQDDSPVESNRLLVSRVRESLVNINNSNAPLTILLQHPHNEEDVKWTCVLGVKVEGDSITMEFTSRELLLQLLSVVDTVSAAISVSGGKKGVSSASISTGTLLDVLQTNMSDHSSRPLLVSLLWLSLLGWTIRSVSTSHQQQQQLCAVCSLCNRCVPLSGVTLFNAVSQHKPYCSFIRPQQTSASSADKDSLGYQTLVKAMYEVCQYPLKYTTLTSNSGYSEKSVKLARSEGIVAASENSSALESAEQSYKRIKLVLNNTL